MRTKWIEVATFLLLLLLLLLLRVEWIVRWWSVCALF